MEQILNENKIQANELTNKCREEFNLQKYLVNFNNCIKEGNNS